MNVAYWGEAATTPAPAPAPLPIDAPNHDNEWNHSTNYVIAGLAWLGSCINTAIPSFLLVDCPREKYVRRLEEKWSQRFSNLEDSAQIYNKREVFDNPSIGSLTAGCISVYTQRASLTLDWSERNPNDIPRTPGQAHATIRLSNHRPAGEIVLNRYSTRRIQRMYESDVSFIALSVIQRNKILDRHVGASSCSLYSRGPGFEPKAQELKSSISRYFGFPCSSREKQVDGIVHIVECPQHANFLAPLPDQYRQSSLPKLHSEYDGCSLHVGISRDGDEGYKNKAIKYKVKAHERHHMVLCYTDIEGSLLHDCDRPILLNVLLIAPSTNRGKERRVYQRLGVATIYLKRWVEATPKFETIVLE
jgi:hypothetical protein